MLVNGNLGAGVAVAGAFGLVRFRSAPGTAREISGVFLSMALGLATGMGYVGLAVVAFVILAAALALLIFLVSSGSRTMQFSAAVSILAAIVVGFLNKEERLTFGKIVEALEAGAKCVWQEGGAGDRDSV